MGGTKAVCQNRSALMQIEKWFPYIKNLDLAGSHVLGGSDKTFIILPGLITRPEPELRVVGLHLSPKLACRQGLAQPFISGKAGQERDGSGRHHWIRLRPSAQL